MGKVDVKAVRNAVYRAIGSRVWLNPTEEGIDLM